MLVMDSSIGKKTNSDFYKEILLTPVTYLKKEWDFRTQSVLLDTIHVKKSKGRLIPSRYIILILGFLSCVVVMSQRLNLSMALVAMVSHTAQFHISDSNVSECSPLYSNEGTSMEMHEVIEGHLSWGAEVQGYIISASFFGFMLTNMPGGRLSETLGAKKVLIFSLTVASVCNILSPLASVWGAYALLGVQFIKGVSQGLTQPAVSFMMAQWYPVNEKGFLSSVTFSGYPAGAIVGGLLSGCFCDSTFLGGWPLAFYVFGFIGLILTIFVYIFASNSPEEDDCISKEELSYIISHREASSIDTNITIPWKSMMSSPGTWAIFIGMFGQYWMTFYFLSVHPTYLKTVLHFTNTESGYLNSFPYIGQLVITWTSSYASDWLVNRNYTSTNTMRKVCNSLGCIGFSFSLIGVVFARCNHTMNVILFIIAISSVGFGYPGCCIVPIDMSLAFAGTLMGITCTVASTSGFIIPLTVGYLTNNQQTLHQWAKVLYTSAGVGLGSGLIFNIFGSARLQAWDSKVDKAKSNIVSVTNDAFEATETFQNPRIQVYSLDFIHEPSSTFVEKI